MRPNPESFAAERAGADGSNPVPPSMTSTRIRLSRFTRRMISSHSVVEARQTAPETTSDVRTATSIATPRGTSRISLATAMRASVGAVVSRGSRNSLGAAVASAHHLRVSGAATREVFVVDAGPTIPALRPFRHGLTA